MNLLKLFFKEIKTKLSQATILVLHDFAKTRELDCDASGVGIGDVLSQERQPLHSLKRSSVKQDNSGAPTNKNYMLFLELQKLGKTICCLTSSLSTLIINP
jgi:hypothetical protein